MLMDVQSHSDTWEHAVISENLEKQNMAGHDSWTINNGGREATGWPKQNIMQDEWKLPFAASINPGDGCIKDETVSSSHSGDLGVCVSDHTDDVADNSCDSDDEFLDEDFDYDSDSSRKSHEIHKTSKWCKAFFECMNMLSVEKINSPIMRWHCPACQGGPGAIHRYKGLLTLITHSKTKTKRRAKLHYKFSKLLEEEMLTRGALVTPLSQASSRWEGLTETFKDHEIVWPPMVIIMNTRYEQDKTGKWNGMGTHELLTYFKNYHPIKARNSYDPEGHRGMSALIFKSSVAGYLEAEHLHKHFSDQERDRNSWEHSEYSFNASGKQKLYGYMARKDDLDIFNQHSQGKSILKFEMRSYQQMVKSVQVSIDDHQLENKTKPQEYLRDLDKLHQSIKEYRNREELTKLGHAQNKEIDALRDHIKLIQQTINTQENIFQKQQGAEPEPEISEQLNGNLSAIDAGQRTGTITAKLPKFQEQDMEEYNTSREKLIKNHQEIEDVIMIRYWQQKLQLKEKLKEQLTQLMEKYSFLKQK